MMFVRRSVKEATVFSRAMLMVLALPLALPGQEPLFQLPGGKDPPDLNPPKKPGGSPSPKKLPPTLQVTETALSEYARNFGIVETELNALRERLRRLEGGPSEPPPGELEKLKEDLDALTNTVEVLEDKVKALEDRVAASTALLEDRMVALERRTEDLETSNETLRDSLPSPQQKEILGHLTIVQLEDGHGGRRKTIRINAANLQIVDGSGATNGDPNDPFNVRPNGLGNLIIGYNEPRASLGDTQFPEPDSRLGSHNLIIGWLHNYNAFGALACGAANGVGLYGIALGNRNTAAGIGATVTGGTGNTATGDYSSVSGGRNRLAAGSFNWVGGGCYFCQN